MTVISDAKNHVAHIVLNRPDKLNALTKEMFKILSRDFKIYDEDPTIKTILVESMGRGSFSAGGDVIEMYRDIAENESLEERAVFFDLEYTMDLDLHHLKTPYVALWEGVVMGGGAGMTISADVIFADNTVQWAMPETRLGFCPDVGMGYYLSQLPQPIAMYLGLSGTPITGSDLVRLGLATHYIDPKKLPIVRSEVLAVRKKNTAEETIKELKDIGDWHCKPLEDTPMTRDMEAINHYYSAPTLKEIMVRLEEGDDPFDKHHSAVLKQRCPLALALQFEKYFAGKDLSLADTYALDKKIILDGIVRGNVQEGVRVAMIDKGDTPTWSPATLDEVTPKMVKEILSLD
ncbi:MAG: enoyl-CoA hydratase/isomerase family protein [Eubacteriaceae bacterium]|jgi:enoyl-CoA hydratase/carnithine racemase|nr:enoyl-CoA hydratase/isomerase family protein [Eubacteriaceae bacterium]